MMYLGDFDEDATVIVPYNTQVNGVPTAPSATLEEADIKVHKNGSATALTLTASTIAITNPFVGVYLIDIDTNNDTDFTTGAEYTVAIDPSDETLGGVDWGGVVGHFSIENRFTDAKQIAGSATAASNLRESAEAIIVGACTGTPTTTSTNTDLTGYANDELIGALIVFKSGTANGQRAIITDYVSTNGVVSFDAIPTAPVATDAFVIV